MHDTLPAGLGNFHLLGKVALMSRANSRQIFPGRSHLPHQSNSQPRHCRASCLFLFARMDHRRIPICRPSVDIRNAVASPSWPILYHLASPIFDLWSLHGASKRLLPFGHANPSFHELSYLIRKRYHQNSNTPIQQIAAETEAAINTTQCYAINTPRLFHNPV